MLRVVERVVSQRHIVALHHNGRIHVKRHLGRHTLHTYLLCRGSLLSVGISHLERHIVGAGSIVRHRYIRLV